MNKWNVGACRMQQLLRWNPGGYELEKWARSMGFAPFEREEEDLWMLR